MPVSKLDTAVRRAAADQLISAAEAKTLVKEAKASGSKKPIDDVFKAIDRADAAVDTKATRLILKELDQKLTKAEWVHYAQKAASTAGVWGPGDEGTTTVKRGELPPALQKVFDRWQKSSPEDEVDVVTFEVAGKQAYLMSQYSEFGTSFGLFDDAGKSIELKEDTVNVRRSAKRLQGMYDQHFNAPEFKAWKGTIEHTDIGIIKNFYATAAELKGTPRTDALTPAMKAVLAEDKKAMKGRDSASEVFRNKKDGSVLLITHAADYRGPEHYALFSKAGALLKRFDIDT